MLHFLTGKTNILVGKKKGPCKGTSRAFTIVEMLVCLAILMTVSSVMLVKNAQFRQHLLLRSLAYEIALAIRQAQVYGLGVREYEGISDPIAAFQVGYGLHFDFATPTTFILYADIDGDHVYQAGSEDRIIQTSEFSPGNRIVTICAGAVVLSGCVSGPPGVLDIEYERPNPEAFINGTQVQPWATVRIESPFGDQRVVAASTMGQIIVQ